MDVKKVTEFLKTRGVRGPCEVCGSQEGWITGATEFERTVGLFNPRADDGGYVMPGGITPAIILVCKNCTNIRLFSEILLKSFMEADDG